MNLNGDRFHLPGDLHGRVLQAQRRGRALQALALAAVATFTVSSCGLRQPETPGAPAASGSGPVVHQVGDTTVIMEPDRALQEVVSPQGGGRCTIDAAKICAAYGQLVPAAVDSMKVSAEPGPAAGYSRTVSIQIPGGPAIAVQCRYAGPGGALVSAAAAPDTPLDADSRAFLAAHGFCAAGPPGG